MAVAAATTSIAALLLILLSASLSFPQSLPAAPSAASLHPVINAIGSDLRATEAMDVMRHVYSTDRWFNFEKFGETAQYLKGAMHQAGLENVKIGKPPADGVTNAGFWTTPLAWDAKQATLEIVDPPLPAETRAFCDDQKVPTSLGGWSGSTPPGGITAEVVEVRDWPAEKIARMNLRGKLAMTDENPANIKWALVKAGALGATYASSENPSLQDARQWMNAWGDYGWGVHQRQRAAALLLHHSAPGLDGVAPHRSTRCRPREGGGGRSTITPCHCPETRLRSGPLCLGSHIRSNGGVARGGPRLRAKSDLLGTALLPFGCRG